MMGGRLSRLGASYTSPLRGEVDRASRGRVRGSRLNFANSVGAPSPRPSPHRGEGRLALFTAVLLGLSVSFAGPAAAEKVGVAAAVNPDAFSSLAGAPQSQLNIGKSIFYNERINTTGSGPTRRPAT